MPRLQKFTLFILIFTILTTHVASATEADVKKTHLEDIFIWKMSDELKLSAKEEKKFTEIQKNLNRKKSELNRQIQESSQELAPLLTGSSAKLTSTLKKYRKLVVQYNQLSLTEFDSIKDLLGETKFAAYLQIKSEITNKVKSLLVGEKDKKEVLVAPLPAPKIIIEKNTADP